MQDCSLSVRGTQAHFWSEELNNRSYAEFAITLSHLVLARVSILTSAGSPLMSVEGRWRCHRPQLSYLNAFGDRECVFQIDAKIAHSAVHLGVTKQQLHGTQIASLTIDLCNVGSAHRVRVVCARPEILVPRHRRISYPIRKGFTRALSHLKPHRRAGLAL